MPRLLPTISLEFEDTGFDAFIRALDEVEGTELRVGVNPVAHPRTKESLDNILLWLEFGTSSQPPRPFVLPTLDTNAGNYGNRYLNRVVRGVLFGNATASEEALHDLGTKVVADLKNRLIRMRSPKNAPSTIARKGGRNPGIETGTLVDNINFVVDKG